MFQNKELLLILNNFYELLLPYFLQSNIFTAKSYTPHIFTVFFISCGNSILFMVFLTLTRVHKNFYLYCKNYFQLKLELYGFNFNLSDQICEKK